MKDLSNENVIHVKKNGVEYLQFRKLLEYSDIIKHAYAIGLEPNFRTARAKNATPLTNEEYEKAVNDYRKLADSIGIDYINIAKPNQAHTKNIKVVEKKVNGNEPDFNLKEYEQIDGLVTDKKNIALATTNADCILLLFFDPTKRVIANVHSGWRGTLQRISVETINKMKSQYGCNPEDIICCICPSIRKCHFKVHKDVQEPFYNEFKDLKEIDEIIVPVDGEERWSIDTVKINEIILVQAGLKKTNIIDCGICSVCNSDLIHSFRVEKETYGLETALIELID
jgi:YfiH family protein